MICCAICGATTSTSDWDDNSETGYDYEVLSEDEDVSWLQDTLVICENPDTPLIDKVYVVSSWWDGIEYFAIEPNSSANCPTEIQMAFGEMVLWPYYRTDKHPLAIPYHKKCYELLKQAIYHRFGSQQDIDKDVLYRALKSLALGGIPASVLHGVDWGSIKQCQAERWTTICGTEAFVVNPIDIPQLDYYLEHLHLWNSPKAARKTETQSPTYSTLVTHDPFSTLPTELLFKILVDLPMASLKMLKTASLPVAQFQLDEFFWKKKIVHDMPWIYELPKYLREYRDEDLDWSKIYQDLLVGSENEDPEMMLGLVNRRRIWELSDQIIDPYANYKRAKEEQPPLPPVLANINTTEMLALTWPEPTKVDMGILPLLNNLEDLDHTRPTISVFWSQEGTLAGFSVEYSDSSGAATERTLGRRENFATFDLVKIEKDDWVRGLILTLRAEEPHGDPLCRKVLGIKFLFIHREPVQMGESTGDQRLIHATPDNIPVGLMAQWSETGNISGLCLIQAFRTRCHTSAAFQIILGIAERQYSDWAVSTKVWKDDIPPPHITMAYDYLQPFVSGFNPTHAQMEALVFGEDEQELSFITAVSVDVAGGGLEVSYSNQRAKHIGPRCHAMKTMDIDGRGGERIVAACFEVTRSRYAVKLMTNRNRQLLIGDSYRYYDMEIDLNPAGLTLCGLFMHWSKRSEPFTTCAGAGGLYFHSQDTDYIDTGSGPRDTNGHPWDPEPPPVSWAERGLVHGKHKLTWCGPGDAPPEWRRRKNVPSEYAVVTWLDCSRLIDKLKLVLGHPGDGTMRFSLFGVVIMYSDATTASVGPSRLIMPTDKKGIHGSPWCLCCTRNYDDDLKNEVAQTPHLYWKEWIVGHEHLTAMRIWANESLSGFQFVSETGESPQWGICKGPATGVVEFGHGLSKATGLKFYMDSNCPRKGLSDTIIVGIQALAEDPATEGVSE